MTGLEAGIVTADAARLVEFYTDGLGFTLEALLEFPQGTVHRLRRGEARIKLYQPAQGAEAPPPADPWHRYRGFAYAALHVDDAEAEVAQAARHGAGVVMRVTRHRPGACFALITDPDGNLWEVLEEAGA